MTPSLNWASGVALLCKRTPLAQRRRVVAAHVSVPAPLKVLPPCRDGKRQDQQCGEDAFHAHIGHLAGGSVNDEVGGQFLILRVELAGPIFRSD